MGTIYRVHEGMQRECNDVTFEEFTKHTQLK
jgi:hypothetical protein